MADAHPDVGTLQWAVGIVATGAAAAWSWTWTEIRSLRQRIHDQGNAAQKAVVAGDDKLWAELRENASRGQEFREKVLVRIGELPSREDLRELREEIRSLKHELNLSRAPH